MEFTGEEVSRKPTMNRQAKRCNEFCSVILATLLLRTRSSVRWEGSWGRVGREEVSGLLPVTVKWKIRRNQAACASYSVINGFSVVIFFLFKLYNFWEMFAVWILSVVVEVVFFFETDLVALGELFLSPGSAALLPNFELCFKLCLKIVNPFNFSIVNIMKCHRFIAVYAAAASSSLSATVAKWLGFVEFWKFKDTNLCNFLKRSLTPKR